MNEVIYKTERDSQTREWTYGCQGEGWKGEIDWEFGININTLLYLKQIANKDLLHSTGTPFLNGKKELKRIDTCIRITESLCCIPETNTTLLINYSPI